MLFHYKFSPTLFFLCPFILLTLYLYFSFTPYKPSHYGWTEIQSELCFMASTECDFTNKMRKKKDFF